MRFLVVGGQKNRLAKCNDESRLVRGSGLMLKSYRLNRHRSEKL